MIRKTLALIAMLFFCLIAIGNEVVGQKQEEAFVSLGMGSYATKRPVDCKPLPNRIYKSKALAGPTPTNQWWSSILWQPHSSNLFAHPLGAVGHDGGLSISYPGAAMVAAEDAIMGGGVNSNGDINIGLDGGTTFEETIVDDFSQSFVTPAFKTENSKLTTSLGHGSPFVFCRHGDENLKFSPGKRKNVKPRLSFAEKPIVWFGKNGDATIGLTVRGNHYAIFGSAGSRWKGTDEKTVVCDQSNGYFSIALLPDNARKTLELFSNYAHNHVVESSVDYKIKNGTLESTWSFTTRSMEGKSNGTVIALYPHQWKYSESKLTKLTYQSVRGMMKVATGTEFSTNVPIQGVLPILPGSEIPDRDRLIGYLNEESAKESQGFGDTYWEGKRLGKLATLAGIAESINEKKLESRFVSEIKSRLENWFVASPEETSPLFYYDKKWGTLIGSRPSYGSDEQLNDHHFHYGYFIRAAAEVARRDPDWAKKWKPMVELLIRDVASHDPNDKLFPYMRCFDMYAGHSWASGHAKFADGNNQESSSESMNAWYGLMLWGQAIGNDQIRDTGIFLFNTERTAIEEYWFDVSSINFPDKFPNVALGMVWGGKGAFATWFSADIDCIHGINWLPFTPASIYMGRFPGYVKTNHDTIISKRDGGDDYDNGWGDLVAMFGALENPDPLVQFMDANPDCKIESGNTHAFMYQWGHTLKRLGQNDSSVTADYPFANVFIKNGKRAYAVFNFKDEPLEVRFSDGKVIETAKNGMTLEAVPKPSQ